MYSCLLKNYFKKKKKKNIRPRRIILLHIFMFPLCLSFYCRNTQTGYKVCSQHRTLYSIVTFYLYCNFAVFFFFFFSTITCSLCWVSSTKYLWYLVRAIGNRTQIYLMQGLKPAKLGQEGGECYLFSIFNSSYSSDLSFWNYLFKNLCMYVISVLLYLYFAAITHFRLL